MLDNGRNERAGGHQYSYSMPDTDRVLPSNKLQCPSSSFTPSTSIRSMRFSFLAKTNKKLLSLSSHISLAPAAQTVTRQPDLDLPSSSPIHFSFPSDSPSLKLLRICLRRFLTGTNQSSHPGRFLSKESPLLNPQSQLLKSDRPLPNIRISLLLFLRSSYARNTYVFSLILPLHCLRRRQDTIVLWNCITWLLI